MKNLAVAVAFVPSNQDGNISGLQPTGHPIYHENGAMEYLARDKLVPLACSLGMEAMAFITWKESEDGAHGKLLSGVREQIRLAEAWLDSFPGRWFTAIVSLHTDSGTSPHTFGLVAEGAVVGNSLVVSLTASVGRGFRHSDRRVLSRLGDKDYSTYIFAQAGYPSVLLEIGSHQNAADLRVLYENVDAVAQAIVEGVYEGLTGEVLSVVKQLPPWVESYHRVILSLAEAQAATGEAGAAIESAVKALRGD